MLHEGMRIDHWDIGCKVSPNEEGGYTIVRIWVLSDRLTVVQIDRRPLVKQIFLVRDGLRAGLGTNPSQEYCKMHLKHATKDRIGCNDLQPGELELLQAAYKQHKHELPRYGYVL